MNSFQHLIRFTADSPATFETPQRDNLGHQSAFSTPRSTFAERDSDTLSTTSKRSKKGPSDGHSLDSFLATHTSEDNCSFQELMETADRKLRQKFSVLFEAEQETALAIAHSLNLPSIEDQFKEIIGPKKVTYSFDRIEKHITTHSFKQIDTWKYKNINSIMYIPDAVELTKVEQMEQADKKQGIEYGNTRFMSNPFNEKQSKETICELAKSQVCI